MEQIIHKIAIDFLRPEKKVIKIAKNDAYSRVFQIAMYANGIPYEPDDSSVLYAVYYSKQDGTAGGYDTMPDNTTPAVTPSGNILTAQLAPQVTTCPGHVKFGVALYKTTGEQLQTFDIDLLVEDSAGEGEISNDYWNLQSIAGIQTAVQILQNRCVSMTGATASSDGAPGFVPGPQHGEQNDVLHGDGRWRPVQVYADDVGVQVVVGGQNCGNVDEALQALAAGGGGGGTVPVMQPASAESDGAAGLAPKPEKGKQNAVLHGDATWRGISADDISVQAQKIGAENVQDAISELEDIAYNQPDAIAETAIVHSINHRGYSSGAPENTLPAFLLSKAKGFDMVETDITFTQDGVAVLLHDSSINRTARNADGTELSATVNIADITYAQALEYDFGIWKDAKYAGTKIPTLAEFLKLCKHNSIHPYLEMKSSGLTPENIATAVNEVKAAGMLGKVTWISFNYATLAEVGALDKVDRLGLILSEATTAANIKAAQDLDATGKRSFLDGASFTAQDIALCKAAGVRLEVWGIASSSERTVIPTLDAYISGVTSTYFPASWLMENVRSKRLDAAHTYIQTVRPGGLNSSGSDTSAGSNQKILIDFLPVCAGEVYEFHYRLPHDGVTDLSPMIYLCFYDEAQQYIAGSYRSINTRGPVINGYYNRKESFTVAQDGYVRIACASHNVASFGLVRIQDADGVLLPSLERLLLERASDTDAQAATLAAQLTPMTGATAQAAGTAGLVPAPASGDNGLFLRGDASWQRVDADDVNFSSVHFDADNVEDALNELYGAFQDTVTAVNTALAAVVGGGSNG